jgi:hypothetical protein
MKIHKLTILTLAVLAALAGAAVAQPAFPGAEGFGAETRGGRGGRIFHVTTLADDGVGSLRAAVEAEGPRIVIFRVTGTIRLASDLKIEHPFITIAGQSAPGEGITLRDHPLVVQTDEVIIRYIRSRLGDESQTESDAVSLARGRNIILDHVSASWSVDETLSVSQRSTGGVPALDAVTVQWSIIAESLNNSVHGKGAHGYGSLVRGSFGARYSFHHNLWAHHRARMPRPGNYETADADPTGPLMDFRNNVFYNWAGSYPGYNADEGSVSSYNFIGNSYIAGANSQEGAVAFREQSSGARAYFAGNAMNGALPADPWSLVRLEAENPNYRAAQAFETAPVSTESADSAYARVLASAGNSRRRDAVDIRIVRSVFDRNGALIDTQTQVGGWPELPSDEPYQDEDHDGMCDVWERSNGLNPRDPSDGITDRDGDGYTNVEEWLNSRATVAP